MKKYVVLLFFLIIMGGLLFGEKVEAIEQFDTTPLNISFAREEPTKPKPPIIDEPTLPGTINPQPYRVGRLPSTGDLITSLIYTIIGFSFLLVVVGVFSLRNIMLKMTWE